MKPAKISVLAPGLIGGSVALGAFGGCRMLSSPHSIRPRSDASLRFGVISDVHLLGRNAAPPEYSDYRGDETVFRQALEQYPGERVGSFASWHAIPYGMNDRKAGPGRASGPRPISSSSARAVSRTFFGWT